MILEAFDTRERVLSVCLEGTEPTEIVGRLTSLAMIASDCGIESIVCRGISLLPEDVRKTVSALAGNNPLFMLDDDPWEESLEESGFDLVSRDPGFFCLSEPDNRRRYSIFFYPDRDGVGKASIFSYIIANVLGFSSFLSFDVRFSLFELLTSIVKNPTIDGSKSWIRVVLERYEEKLSVSIHDRGLEFDPTAGSGSQADPMAETSIFRGLGLAMVRKNADIFSYCREEGKNRTFFEKRNGAAGREEAGGGEGRSPRLKITEGAADGEADAAIRLEGVLDLEGGAKLRLLADGLFEKKISNVRLDMEKVTFVSSSGLGALLGIVTSLREKGGDLVMIGVSRKIISVFRMLGLDGYFRIEDREATPQAQDCQVR